MPSIRHLLLAFLLATFTVGCTAHVHPARHHHEHAKVVVVRKGHVHSDKCGHYLHKGRWYHVERHVHGKRCGHVKVRGVWVLR